MGQLTRQIHGHLARHAADSSVWPPRRPSIDIDNRAAIRRFLATLRREPKVAITTRIVTAADAAFFKPVQILYTSLAVSHDLSGGFTLFDLGLTEEQRQWFDSYGIERIEVGDDDLVIGRDEPGWQTWNKPIYIAKCSGCVLWLDADIIVTGPIDGVDAIIKDRVLLCADNAALHFLGRERGIACLANEDRLYARFPAKRFRDGWPNAGVIGLDLQRDKLLLDTWIYMVEEASSDKSLRGTQSYPPHGALRFFDQGALQWALEHLNLQHLPTQDRRYNDSVAAVGADTMDTLTLRIEATRSQTAVIHFASDHKPYGNIPIGIDFGPDACRNTDITAIVLGHTSDRLTNLPQGPHIKAVRLDELHPDNDLAESRIFHFGDDLEKVATGYTGLCTWRWDSKYRYKSLPLNQLPLLACEPHVVWCAYLSLPAWLAESERSHPGMRDIVIEIATWLGIPQRALQNRQAPWSNNFVAATTVVRDLAAFHREIWPRVIDRFGCRPKYLSPPEREPRHNSYLAERLSMLYFIKHRDCLECRQMPAP